MNTTLRYRQWRYLLILAVMASLASFACGWLGASKPPRTPETPATTTESSGSEKKGDTEGSDRTTRAASPAREAKELGAPMGDLGADMEATGSFLRGDAASARVRLSQAANIKAGAHDDNEEYLSWLAFLDRHAGLEMVLPADYRDRLILRVVDDAGRPVMNQPFALQDRQGRTLWEGQTYASGESVVYPYAFLSQQGQKIARVVLKGETEQNAEWQPGLEGIVAVSLERPRVVPERVPVDVAFILDATGSMSDEIQQLTDVLFSIHSRLQNASSSADLRFGMIIYRDRGDAEPLRIVPFTGDVDSFQVALQSVRATGGGDTPEDVQSGLDAALTKLEWRADGIRNAFLIADAPPHTDYGQQHDYLWAGRTANSRGIRLHMIGASGLSLGGEYIFRQIAATTYGQFIFLTYGETGESAGLATTDDPGKVSHHTGGNWASRRLDDIVVDLVRKDLAYQVSVPVLASDNPEPSDQQEHLSIRLENLWGQMNRQLADYSADTLTAVLLPFENGMPDSGALADYLRDLSVEALLKAGKLRLVERDRLAQVLAEQHLSQSGLIDPSKAIELGHLLNSRLVLTGKVYRLGTDRVVHVRAIDAETAQIVAAARVRV